MKITIHRRRYSCKVRAMGKTGMKALWCKPKRKGKRGVSKRQRKAHEAIYKNFNPFAVDGYRRKRR